MPVSRPPQRTSFGGAGGRLKRRALDDAVDALRGRFGFGCIKAASLIPKTPIATDKCETVPMPAIMYR